jgi:hypothetical protein
MNDFDCGVTKMRSGLVLALGLAAAFVVAPGAYAFQEQKGSTSPAAEAQPAVPAEPTGDAARLSDEAAAKPEAGTEIRIPGLGKLGVLPKMDFGLELLYGAAEGQPASQPEAVPNPEDDLTVRGSVKHRF